MHETVLLRETTKQDNELRQAQLSDCCCYLECGIVRVVETYNWRESSVDCNSRIQERTHAIKVGNTNTKHLQVTRQHDVTRQNRGGNIEVKNRACA